jgi:hypothetical protein
MDASPGEPGENVSEILVSAKARARPRLNPRIKVRRGKRLLELDQISAAQR